MKCIFRALTVLLVAAMLLCVVQPMVAQAQEEMERSGLRPDSPEYGIRGPHWVGYKPIVIGEGMEGDLWYPALNPEGAKEEVTYEFTLNSPEYRSDIPAVTSGNALLDAPLDDTAGPYPLVIFSHGFTLNPEWYTTIPEHYASHGFIVLAPEHVEQFDWDFSEIAPASIDRPLAIKQTLDYAEEINSPGGDLTGQIDMENVAVVGHSYGGYTALAMAGAPYDMEGFTERCEALPEDDPGMFVCAPLVGKEEFLAERAGLEEVPEGLWPSFGDPRVTAIVSMAGDSYLFDEAGLAKITIPMMAIGGTADTLTPYEWGSKPSYDFASSEKKALVTLMGAEHTFMFSQCKNIPWVTKTIWYELICFDPVWHKARALDLTHHFSTAFLLDTLKGDTAAHAALAPEAVDFQGIEYQAEGFEEDMEAVINHIWSEYEEANMAGDSDRWIALWDENGVKLSAGDPPVVGKEAIYAGKVASNERNAAFDVVMKITNEEFEVAGDWAFARGTYTYERTPKEGGDKASFEGKFMTILKKQPDGTWKLYRDFAD